MKTYQKPIADIRVCQNTDVITSSLVSEEMDNVGADIDWNE